MTEEHINKEITKGSLWMIFLRFSVKGVGLISTLILVRLLRPEDFGLMALASSVFAMVELMRAFGFGTALIQNQNAGKDHYDTAWTMQIFFALFASAIIISVSSIVAEYYGDMRLDPILKVMGLIFLLGAFTNIGIVNFRKEMKFHKEYIFNILVKLSSFFVTIPLAYYLRSYWALIIGMVSGRFTILILSYVMQSYRPRISLKSWRELMSFSSWLMLNNFLLFISQHGQNFILAKMLGSESVGFYAVSNEISSLPTAEFVGPINRASFPGYSKMNGDLAKIKIVYLDMLSKISLISIPSSVGIAAIAPTMVPVVFGEKWVEVIPLIVLLAFSNIFIGLGTNLSSVFLAIKKQKLNLYFNMLRNLIFISLIFFFTPIYGFVGVGFALLITSSIMFIFSLFLSAKYLQVKFLDNMSVFYRPIISSYMMFFAIYYYENFGELTILNTFIGIFIGILTYTLALIFFWILVGKPKGVEEKYLNTLRDIFVTKIST